MSRLSTWQASRALLLFFDPFVVDGVCTRLGNPLTVMAESTLLITSIDCYISSGSHNLPINVNGQTVTLMAENTLLITSIDRYISSDWHNLPISINDQPVTLMANIREVKGEVGGRSVHIKQDELDKTVAVESSLR